MTDSGTDDAVRAGVWCLLGETRTAVALAGAGFDWVCLDAQHGLFDRRAVVEALAALPPTAPPVLVRPPALDVAFIGAALDAGAAGVIVPLVNDVQMAREAVAAALYPPQGSRSWGPLAPLWHRAAPAPVQANAAVDVWLMIETPQALAAAPEILGVPGVTGVFVGPNDLSLGLGVDQDAMLADHGDDAPLPVIRRAAQRAGVIAGAWAGDAARASALAAHGFTSIAVTTDAAALAAGAAAALASRP